MRYERTPCECGELHNNEQKTWQWDVMRNQEGKKELIMKCNKCKQVLMVQQVAFGM